MSRYVELLTQILLCARLKRVLSLAAKSGLSRALYVEQVHLIVTEQTSSPKTGSPAFLTLLANPGFELFEERESAEKV